MSVRRVAYVLNVFPKLSETFIANELAELRRRGVDVLILSMRERSETVAHDIVTAAGLIERTVYEPEEFSAALKAFRPDVLHAHFATEPTATARTLGVELGVPYTFTAHGYDIHRKPPADFATRAADAAAVVTVSQANARYIVQRFGVAEERLRVISCGVDTRRFRPNGAAAAAPPRIVAVARLVPVKNLGLLLEACALLRARGLVFRCAVVGEGKCRSELEATRHALALDDVVELVGAATQAQVLSLLRTASVAVLTSHSEGMPVSLMEAAACGLPVVATAVGGVPELVVDNVTGLLVPPGEARALAAALEQLLLDRRLAVRLGAHGRRRVQERFSLARQVKRLVAVWDAVAA